MFDEEGGFWATEMFANDVVHIPFDHPTAQSRFGSQSTTPFPGGIAAGPDEGVYVATNSLTFAPGSGAVVKLTFDDQTISSANRAAWSIGMVAAGSCGRCCSAFSAGE
jgi:hypothetical protein